MAINLETTATRTVEPLTKHQITALKAANSYVILRHHAGEDWIGEIEAIIKTRLYGEDVQSRVAMTVNSCITNYEEGRASDNPLSDEELDALNLRADYMLNYPHETSGLWQTIVKQLKVGDQIQLHWVRGNHNLTTRASGLAVDEVHLTVLRDRRHVAKFMVGYAVGQKNCARMVRTEQESRTYI